MSTNSDAVRRRHLASEARRRRLRWRLRLADAFVIAAVWTGMLLGTNITEPAFRSHLASASLVAVCTFASVSLAQRNSLYMFEPALPRTDEIAGLVTAEAGGIAAMVVFAAFADMRIGAWEVSLGFPLMVIATLVTRGLIREFRQSLPMAAPPARVAIIGCGNEAAEIAEVVTDHPESHFELAGVIGNREVADRFGLTGRWIGATDNMVSVLAEHRVTSVIVTPTSFRSEQYRAISETLFDHGFDVHLSTGVSRLWAGRFEVRSLAHEPLVVMGTQPLKKWSRRAKRFFDVLIASMVLIIASPLMLLTALAIKLDSKGPVFFCQKRAAYQSGTFPMFKFRSMVVDAEELKAKMQEQNQRSGPLFKVSNDPRITRVGRVIRETSIDELPQLVNVLRGEMSLVGPRPALVEEYEAFDDELRGRFKVRPGITGLWQVEARSNASFGAYRRLDLHYVENWSLGLDIRILMATAEQLIVSLARLPLRPFVGGSSDAITTDEAEAAASTANGAVGEPMVVAPATTSGETGNVIDIRDKSRRTQPSTSEMGAVAESRRLSE